MGCPYDGISFGHKKGWSADMGYDLDGPPKQYAKGKEPDTKGHVCGIPFLRNVQNRHIRRDGQGLGARGWG